MAQPKEVKRYRAGRRPLWDVDPKADKTPATTATPKKDQQQLTKGDKSTVDHRLTRLEQATDIGDEQERLIRRRRIIHEATVITPDPNAQDNGANNGNVTKDGDQDNTAPSASAADLPHHMTEEELERRRTNARNNNKREEDPTELPIEAEEEKDEDEEQEEEESSSSISESDSDQAEDWDQFLPTRAPKFQPRFFKKEKRQTLIEKEFILKEQEKLKEEKERQMQERKERTRTLLKEAIERERSSKLIGEPKDEVVVTDDDDDEETQQKEYELWKLRELVRIRRERDERDKWRLERLDVERRRNMTDEEVAAEKRKNKEGFKERKYMKYLQKYYHKGAFYSNELSEIQQTHDWTAPTGEDKWIDRTLLPKVMQVKNFGRAGRTKYTHLKNEDTSKADDPWAATTFNPQYIQKMGGTGGFDRPSKKRKIPNL